MHTNYHDTFAFEVELFYSPCCINFYWSIYFTHKNIETKSTTNKLKTEEFLYYI